MCSYVIGEHGDTSVPIWSSVSIAGTKLRDIFPTAAEDPYDYEKWSQLHQDVVNAADDIINLKGYTSWGIGIMCAKLADAVLKNQVYFLAAIKMIFTASSGLRPTHEIIEVIQHPKQNRRW